MYLFVTSNFSPSILLWFPTLEELLYRHRLAEWLVWPFLSVVFPHHLLGTVLFCHSSNVNVCQFLGSSVLLLLFYFLVAAKICITSQKSTILDPLFTHQLLWYLSSLKCLQKFYKSKQILKIQKEVTRVKLRFFHFTPCYLKSLAHSHKGFISLLHTIFR